MQQSFSLDDVLHVHLGHVLAVGVGDLLLLLHWSGRRLRLLLLLLPNSRSVKSKRLQPVPVRNKTHLLFLLLLAVLAVWAWSHFVPAPGVAGQWSNYTTAAVCRKWCNSGWWILSKVLHPGFISSQVSSCPALGASTPVRMLPLSTWMTLTGRSLIWLVSSKGCVNGGRLSFLENFNKASNSENQFSRNKFTK